MRTDRCLLARIGATNGRGHGDDHDEDHVAEHDGDHDDDHDGDHMMRIMIVHYKQGGGAMSRDLCDFLQRCYRRTGDHQSSTSPPECTSSQVHCFVIFSKHSISWSV